jgi:hypothetical protein
MKKKLGIGGPRSKFDLLASSSGYKKEIRRLQNSWPLNLAPGHVDRDASVSLFEMPHSAEYYAILVFLRRKNTVQYGA